MIELSHRGGIAVVKMMQGKANALDIEFCEAIAAQIFAGNAKAAEAAALAHAQTAGRMTEERLRATDKAA